LKKLYGSHWLLRLLPWWATLLLLNLLSVDVLWFIRYYTEKVGYNIALSSSIGDRWLAVAIAICGEVVKREEGQLGWLSSKAFHGVCALLGIVAAVLMGILPIMQTGKFGSLADLIHNMIIVPSLVYLLLSTGLVVLLRGKPTEKIIVAVCFLVWVGLLKVDMDTGMLNQRQWLEDHGLRFPK
jgi:hypothetical protein